MRAWTTSVLAYTLAGILSSATVGAMSGWIGGLIRAEWESNIGQAIVMGVALVLVVREIGGMRAPLPQWRRQTQPNWARVFPTPVAAALWGFDLGLTFTTLLTFGGAWVAAAIAVLGGHPTFGIAVFVSLWLGRAASVWTSPLVSSSPVGAPRLIDAVAHQRRLLGRIHLVALLAVFVVLALDMILGLSA